MADVAADLKTWSATASNNSPTTATTVGTGLAPNLQEIQKVIRQDLANAATDVASASTTDIGAVASNYCRVTGTTTITALGTVSAGIPKVVRFAGALTVTHNSSSLILPGGASITTAAGDVALLVSEGSGNWRCINYMKAAVDPAGFPPTTAMMFAQTAAPTGWTKSSTHNDKALRVVSGTASSGGATAFTTVFGSGKTVGAHTLSVAETPSHAHPGSTVPVDSTNSGNNTTASRGDGGGAAGNAPLSIASQGGGGSHDHTLSLDLQYVDVIIATKD